MHAKVLKPFYDKKNNGLLRNPGEVFDLNKQRFNAIEKAKPGLIEECEKPDDREPEDREPEGQEPADNAPADSDASGE